MYYSRSFILNGTTDQDYDMVETSTFLDKKTPGNYVRGYIQLVSQSHIFKVICGSLWHTQTFSSSAATMARIKTCIII
jgi:hypothetical protein